MTFNREKNIIRIKNSWTEIPFKECVYLSLGISFVTAILIFLTHTLVPPEVPFFYGKAIGEEQLINSYFLLIGPLASFLITIINLIISLTIGDKFLKKILAVASLFVSLLFTITILKIIFLVGFF